eukprot:1648341-Prymnesium_polylepis.1
MHGSRTRSAQQGAAAQTCHSRRRHTVPSIPHGPRAHNIPAHMPGSSRRTATHGRNDARSSLCPTTAPAIEALAALGGQQLQLHHLLRLLRLEHAGSRRRRHPRRHRWVRLPRAPAARRSASIARGACHAQLSCCHARPAQTSARATFPTATCPTLSGHTSHKKTAFSRR